MEKRGRFIKYDKQQVLQDIVNGALSAKAIAKRHGITRDMVYSLKYAAKKKNIIRDPTTKLDDLDYVEAKAKKQVSAHDVYLLAEDYAAGKLSSVSFYEKLKLMLA